MSEQSYVELCLRALPPEKQEAARKAFHDLVEGAPDDTMLARLLIVLEATAAYGRTIPAEIAAAMQSGIAALDTRLAKLPAPGSLWANEFSQLRRAIDEHLTAFASSLSLNDHRDSLDSVRIAVERVERSVRRLRHVRVTAVALLMAISAAAGAGAVVACFQDDYRSWRRVSEAMSDLANHNIQLSLGRSADRSLVLNIEGPAARATEWTRDAKGRTTGAQITYP